MEVLTREIKENDIVHVENLLKQLNENSQFNGKDFLTSNLFKGFVAIDMSNKVVGFGALCYRYVPSHGRITASIEDVIVDYQARGNGVAKKIIDTIIKEAVCNRLQTINLTSNNKRPQAHSLYLKKGFKKIDSSIFVKYL